MLRHFEANEGRLTSAEVLRRKGAEGNQPSLGLEETIGFHERKLVTKAGDVVEFGGPPRGTKRVSHLVF
jgi:hypothetical protein